MTDLNLILCAEGIEAVREVWDTSRQPWPIRRPEPAASPDRAIKPRFTSTNEILAKEYPPLSWAVDGYVAEGFNVLAGRQKLGKSRMALDFGVAIATGGCALGKIDCILGDVLYIDLENGARRVQRRIVEMFPDPRTRPDLSRLRWEFEAPQIGDALFDLFDAWRSEVPAPRLIVIDVLQRVKPPGRNANQNAYERDYDCYSGLQSWATKHGIAVLALHHTKKCGAEDPLEALSGSNGLSAVADTTLVLDRDASGATLYVRGRDVEEKDSALISVNGQWHLQGDAGAVRQSRQRSVLLDALRDAGEPMSPRDVADVTGSSQQSVRQMLVRMAKTGEAERLGRGTYAIRGHNGHIRHEPDEEHEGVTDLAAERDRSVVTPGCDIEGATERASDADLPTCGRCDGSDPGIVTVVTVVTASRPEPEADGSDPAMGNPAPALGSPPDKCDHARWPS